MAYSLAKELEFSDSSNVAKPIPCQYKESSGLDSNHFGGGDEQEKKHRYVIMNK